MSINAHDAYLESAILTADPVELVLILYRAAIDSVREARSHLANGDICARSKAISKAIEALSELRCSLDHQAGGDLSHRLAALYEYMQQRLIQANFEQVEAPLNEVTGLLTTLLEAWQQVKIGMDQRAAALPAANLGQPVAWSGVPPEPDCAPSSWSA